MALHHVSERDRGPALAEMRRVLAPGGRALVVEFGRRQDRRGVLSPLTFLHGHDAGRVLDDAAAAMRALGFQDVTVGPAGSGLLGYALGRVARHDG